MRRSLDLEAELSEAGKRRLLAGEARPLFLCDWLRTLMIHFAVPAGALQPAVPFPLDLHGDSAFVSLVFFTLRGLRPVAGGRLTSWISAPVATHGFLNLRTYVRHDSEPGIYFLAEWLPNRLAVWLGPRLFGLPYRRGYVQLEYREDTRTVRAHAIDSRKKRQLSCNAEFAGSCMFRPPQVGSLTAFLMERYTAFTRRQGRLGLFRVWHHPWPQQQAASIQLPQLSLLEGSGSWFREAQMVGANYSPGLTDVWIGRPHRSPGYRTPIETLFDFPPVRPRTSFRYSGSANTLANQPEGSSQPVAVAGRPDKQS